MFAHGAGECAPVDLVTGPGQHLHGRGQAPAQGRRRHRLRGRPHRDRHPGRRQRRRGVRRRRPDQPGRARPGCRQRAGDTLRAARRRRRGRARRAGPRDPSTPIASGPRSAGSSPASSWSTTSRRVSPSSTPTPPEHLEIHTEPAAEVAARVRNAGAIFVGPFAPCSSATTAPAPTTCCPRPAARATPPGCRCARSARRPRRRLRRGALAEVADHVVTLAEAEDLPGHGQPSRSGVDDASRCGRSCAVWSLRCPQTRRPRPAQRQREPLPAPVGGGGRHRARRRRGRVASSTATPTASSRPARGPGGLPRARRRVGAGLGRERLQRGDASSCSRPSVAPAGWR